MSWAKVGDELYDDPRSEAAGVDAMGLWVFALSYMARHSTDGWITLERCRRFAGRRARALASRLVQVGWWEAHDDEAFCLVGWEAFLIPRAQVLERSDRAAAAGRKGGQAKASRARENAEPTANPPRTEDQTPTSAPSSLEVREVVPDCKPAEVLETALATRAPDPDPTRPDPDSAQACAHASPGPPPSVIAPALPGLEAVTPKPGRSKGQKTTLPEGWAPKPAHFALGAEKGFDRARVQLEADNFCDRARAGGLMWIDWDAAFRTALRNAKVWADERASKRPAFRSRSESDDFARPRDSDNWPEATAIPPPIWTPPPPREPRPPLPPEAQAIADRLRGMTPEQIEREIQKVHGCAGPEVFR